MKNFFKNICISKNCRIFAGELNMRSSIQALIIAVIFLLNWTNSLGCCFSSDSAILALSSFAKVREQQSFLFLNIFNSTMRSSIKNESKANNSSPISVQPTKQAQLHKQGKSADITVSITGKKNNRIVHAYLKAYYEFFVERTHGYIFSEIRLKNKIEAADLLYPEDKRALRCLTVIMK